MNSSVTRSRHSPDSAETVERQMASFFRPINFRSTPGSSDQNLVAAKTCKLAVMSLEVYEHFMAQ